MFVKTKLAVVTQRTVLSEGGWHGFVCSDQSGLHSEKLERKWKGNAEGWDERDFSLCINFLSPHFHQVPVLKVLYEPYIIDNIVKDNTSENSFQKIYFASTEFDSITKYLKYILIIVVKFQVSCISIGH